MPDPAAALRQAAASGVAGVVALSEDPVSVSAVLALAAAHPTTVLAGVGLHPVWVTGQTEPAVRAALTALEGIAHQAAVVGEIGLDWLWADTDAKQAQQRETLEALLDLAARRRLPVNLHSRRCQRQVLEIAADFHRRTGLAAQLHWFTQSEKLVRRAGEEGLFVSVGPTAIDHEPTQRVVRAIAADLLLLESDAPVPVGGVPGHPRRVAETARAVATTRGVPLADLTRQTRANLDRYLGVEGGAPEGS